MTLPDTPLGSRPYRFWMLALLVAIYASSSLDRLILATIAPALKHDLRISDLQFGLLSGLAFSLLYTLGGLPVGRLADRTRRIPILAAAAAIWSVMTALSAFVGSFTQLVLLRVGLGLGEAGCTPTIYSLLSDQYPPRRRAAAIAILGIGVPIGSAMGALLGGWTSEHGGWRHAFLLAGAPGLLFALLAITTLREPPRGHFDAVRADSDVPPMGAVLRRMLSKPACLHMMACATLCIFCNNGLNLFLPSFFVRIHGLTPFQAGKYFGVLIGVAAAVGTTGLGLLVSRLGRNDPRWYGWGPALILVIGTPLYAIAFLVDRFATAYALLFAATCIGFAFLGPMVGAIQNMVEPRMRASASAILLVAMQLIGGGCGPAFSGWASDLFARHAFVGDYGLSCPPGQAIAAACRQASATGLREALLVCSLFFLWAAFHAAMAARTLVRDLSTLPPAPRPSVGEEAFA